MRTKLEYSTVATAFCEPTFLLPDLRRVYEAVWDTTVDPRNFQRKVLSADDQQRLNDEAAREVAGV